MNTAQEKRNHMLSLVEKWRGSGQTQQEFCSFHGIKIHTLSYWIGVSKEEKGPSGFMEILPTNDTIQKIEVIYPNAVKVNAGFANLKLPADIIRLSTFFSLFESSYNLCFCKTCLFSSY